MANIVVPVAPARSVFLYQSLVLNAFVTPFNVAYIVAVG